MQIAKYMLLVSLVPCALVQSTFLELRLEWLATPMRLFYTMFILFWAKLLQYSFLTEGWGSNCYWGLMISLQMPCKVLDSIRKQHWKLRELMVYHCWRGFWENKGKIPNVLYLSFFSQLMASSHWSSTSNNRLCSPS